MPAYWGSVPARAEFSVGALGLDAPNSQALLRGVPVNLRSLPHELSLTQNPFATIGGRFVSSGVGL